MRIHAFLCICCSLLLGRELRAQNGYSYTIDLTHVVQDRVQVTLFPPLQKSDKIEFQMPKIVPGTYAISDFGRFITGFEATDTAGNPLPVDYIDENRWLIRDAQGMQKITYWVDDTFDSQESPSILDPGGTNIEEQRIFVLNTFGFCGYLAGMKDLPITLTVKKPKGFYGSTALLPSRTGENEDTYEVQNYHRLVDSPIMYCLPDTAWEHIGGTGVLVSVYSPNRRVSAKSVMHHLSEIMMAQRDYLGGKLPVERYAFLVGLIPRSGPGEAGALEHSYSSLYLLPEADEESVGRMMRGLAAHEFFHILTPLRIHSEEIHDFDFMDPRMSRHLWLYEGLTEYAAGHFQVKQGLISIGQYFRILQEKIKMASQMNDSVPFTRISSGCLEEYKSQYPNVYQKGALIGMFLDIQLRKLSGGRMGTQELMRELAKSYGEDRPFKDDELFDKITALTYPEIGAFFKKHVDGPDPLPYAEVLGMAGLRYEPQYRSEVLAFGHAEMKPHPVTGRLQIVGTDNMDKFGQRLGYEVGDELVSFDGKPVNPGNSEDIFARYQAEHRAGGIIKAVARRPDGKGKYEEKVLKAKAMRIELQDTHLIRIDPQATPEQLAVRKAWLGH